jgi:3-phenylpropionate/trans-cinnamate dioxygenase ferredoxin reductase subunit
VFTAPTYVIVGGGLAGATAAETLRNEGFTGRVHLVGAEPERPYHRPPLSKDYLAGSTERDKIFVHDSAWYEDHDVELSLSTRATGLDPAAHTIILDGGRRLRYAKLLLATGASARRLPLPGAGLVGVRYLRDVADADRLREVLSAGGRNVVVVGGGWIGLETAAAARGHHNRVTVVEHGPTPLHGVLGPELGEVFAGLHREHGVDLRVRTGVSEFTGSAGRLTAVVTDGGEQVPADIAIVGVGARPNTELAEAAGLAVDNGVLVDAALRSSHPDIHAAGDVANQFSPLLGRHLRIEHWANAKQGGPAAARSMLGQDITYDPVPYFYTDQYDLGMEYSGHVVPGSYDSVVYRGDLDGRTFIAFWLAAGRVVAGMNVNMWGVTDAIQQLIRSGAVVDEQRLRDPNVPLEESVMAYGGVA